MLSTTKIGIIICGNIANIYFETIAKLENIEVVACADIVVERAKKKAATFGIRKTLNVDALIVDPDVKIVLNLTIPEAHFSIAKQVLLADKHIYNEKPICTTLSDAKSLIELAMIRNLRIGSAPDTFFAGAQQMARSIIERGDIGVPIAATAIVMERGVENWHPDPEFFFKDGAGPLLDLGPYYLTTLVNMLGPIKSVSAMANQMVAKRVVGSEPKRGQTITVQTPTHISTSLNFNSGVIGTLIASYDVWRHTHYPIEIYGSDGTLLVPDPNLFGGKVQLKRHDKREWIEEPTRIGLNENSRGVSLADMTDAIKNNRPHRASGELAYHILEVARGILNSAESGECILIASKPNRPEPLRISEVHRLLV